MPIIAPQHDKIAKQLHQRVTYLLSEHGSGGLMVEMHDLMDDFKIILDNAVPGEIDALCEKYNGFYQMASLLEDMATAIQSGDVKVPQ